MTAAITVWTLTYLVHSTILIAVAAVASMVIRSASARDTLWKIALIGGFITATLQFAMPLERVVPQNAAPRITMPAPPAADVAESHATAPANTAAPVAPPKAPLPWFAIVWALATTALASRVLLGRRRFLASLGRRAEIVAGPDRALLDRVADAARVRRPIRLTQSDSIPSPVAMLGWEIVIPSRTFSLLNDEQRETILAHEVAHLTRRDPLWLTAAELIKAVVFFQPLNWLVQTRLKSIAEFLCDDAAVLLTGNRKALAETLAELATRVTFAAPAVAAMAEGNSSLVQRVKRVLQSERIDTPLALGLRLAFALAIIAATALFAPGMTIAAPARAAEQVLVSPTRHAVSEDECRCIDTVLHHDFDGPDGRTHVSLDAHNVIVKYDGSSVRFESADGFLRVREVSERGPVREVSVTPATDGHTPMYRYTVAGRDESWSDAAEALIAASFGTPRNAKPVRAARQVRSAETPHTWQATIELTGDSDGQPTHLMIRSHGIRYTDAGDVIIGSDSSLHVEQTIGSARRAFDLNGSEHRFESSDSWTRDEQIAWLRTLLRNNTTLPRTIVDALTDF